MKHLFGAFILISMPAFGAFHTIENQTQYKVRVEVELTKDSKGLIIPAGKSAQIELEGECTKKISAKGLEGDLQGKSAESDFNPPCMTAQITIKEEPPKSLKIIIAPKES